MSTESPTPKKNEPPSPTRFFLRGLAISLPPILTLVILIWVGIAINDYIIQPVGLTVRYAISRAIDESRPTDEFVKWEKLPVLDQHNRPYRVTPELKDELQQKLRQVELERSQSQDAEEKSDVVALEKIPVEWVKLGLDRVYVPFGRRSVPFRDYEQVAEELAPGDIPTTTTSFYMELVTIRYFGSQFLLIAGAVSILIIMLYFLGRFVTARVGSWAVHKAETTVLARLPLVNQVYSSVKQVTDFFFSERTVEYNSVVALEYPRKGIWSIGFVTSDSMLEITVAAGEPLVTVLMPTSPMPMTGFAVNVPRSHVVDLDITIDQAFQFCLSCGVLIPEQQKVTPELLQQELAKRLVGNTGVPAPPAKQHPTPPEAAS